MIVCRSESPHGYMYVIKQSCSLCVFCCCSEPTVRAELMEQVPNIAMFLHESRPNFPAAFSRYLVPIVVRYLTDPNNQVCLEKFPVQ